MNKKDRLKTELKVVKDYMEGKSYNGKQYTPSEIVKGLQEMYGLVDEKQVKLVNPKEREERIVNEFKQQIQDIHKDQ